MQFVLWIFFQELWFGCRENQLNYGVTVLKDKWSVLLNALCHIVSLCEQLYLLWFNWTILVIHLLFLCKCISAQMAIGCSMLASIRYVHRFVERCFCENISPPWSRLLFFHILYGYFTGTGEVEWLSQCPCTNPEENWNTVQSLI